MRAQHREEESVPAEIAWHKGQQGCGVIAADHDDIGPVKLKRPHACRQHQPFIRANSWGVIRSGQYRGLCRWPANRRHKGRGSQYARDAVRLTSLMPEIRTNRVSGSKPLTEFIYFVYPLEIGSIEAVGPRPRALPV